MYKPHHSDEPDALEVRVTPFADRAKPEVRGPALRPGHADLSQYRAGVGSQF